MSAVAEREFDFSEQDFQRVARLIRERAGIALNNSKRNMVYSRLSRRLREGRFQSFASYLDALEKTAGDDEWQHFVNALTTNLTAFFREAHHFDTFAEHLKALSEPPRIWCAAASTGEEPYSIAMTVIEHASRFSGTARIVASDIDTEVLARARAGVYALDSASALGESRMRRFFLRGKGANEGKVRVRPELQRGLEFMRLNLLDPRWPFNEQFDTVFCRNVMIYFDKPTQHAILEKIHRVMIPNGLLFVGHSENFTDRRDLFKLIGKTAYRRV
ncbi:MAG TPA: CheR family methyltransferase [Burkholderiaceae bacterium]|nr:CheR family methyltransferase [Burkholderiaceae bacterium]